jgi:hypothetical protein
MGAGGQFFELSKVKPQSDNSRKAREKKSRSKKSAKQKQKGKGSGMGGDSEIFLEDVRHDFKCMVCLEVLEDPVSACKEGHPSCRTCLAEWVEKHGSCPVCREKISLHSLQKCRIGTLLSRFHTFSSYCETISLGSRIYSFFTSQPKTSLATSKSDVSTAPQKTARRE